MEYMPFDPHYWMSAAKKKEKNSKWNQDAAWSDYFHINTTAFSFRLFNFLERGT